MKIKKKFNKIVRIEAFLHSVHMEILFQKKRFE